MSMSIQMKIRRGEYSRDFLIQDIFHIFIFNYSQWRRKLSVLESISLSTIKSRFRWGHLVIFFTLVVVIVMLLASFIEVESEEMFKNYAQNMEILKILSFLLFSIHFFYYFVLSFNFHENPSSARIARFQSLATSWDIVRNINRNFFTAKLLLLLCFQLYLSLPECAECFS